MWSKARSTARSKWPTPLRAAATRPFTPVTLPGDDHMLAGSAGDDHMLAGSAGDDELPRLGGVAPEGRAEVLEGAPVAQGGGVGPEVLVGAGPLDRLPDGGRALLEAPNRLVRRLGHDGHRLGQVEELDLRRAAPEHPLAQEGVEVDAAEAALL